jgi:PAS domain S-box-containing protein
MSATHDPPEQLPGAPTPADWTWPLGAQLAQAALEKAPSIIYIYDVQAEKSIFQNRRFAELLGHPLQEPAQNDWRNYIHEEDALGFPEYRERLKAIKPGEELSWTFRMRHVTGDWHHFAARDVLLRADEDGTPRLIVGHAVNVNEQKATEERKNLLLGEMRHRARNLVTLIDAIGRQSMPRDKPEVVQFFEAFMGRMRALLDTADAVLSSEHRMADLRAVANSALAPFVAGNRPRLNVNGPRVFVSENAAGNLALTFHELATNATKYGALSRAEGAVIVSWDIERGAGGKRTVALDWRERGGPPVVPPSREGYGSRVIKNALRGSDGEVALDFRPEGVHCRITFALPQQQS